MSGTTGSQTSRSFPLKICVLAALVLAVALWSAACGGGTSYSTSGPATPAAGTTGSQTGAKSGSSVSIRNFAFMPNTITVSKGATVVWTNNDSVSHTVTSDNGKFDSGTLSPGKTFSFTFDTPGAYNYHCSIHTYMKGEIIVQ